eukprot:TRINITY_DN11836_c0_g1_i1.p1 TRINITY_DN11836_c0_g1~~TRINITY_DN11836_c0_g1_i1.p1  ORF type:complete len:252 (+),score=37.98 TRINITY_DN11836_c0_g1_i1:124-879(+)
MGWSHRGYGSWRRGSAATRAAASVLEPRTEVNSPASEGLDVEWCDAEGRIPPGRLAVVALRRRARALQQRAACCGTCARKSTDPSTARGRGSALRRSASAPTLSAAPAAGGADAAEPCGRAPPRQPACFSPPPGATPNAGSTTCSSAEYSPSGGSQERRYGIYTREEVATHCTPDSCWLVAHGKVYDATPILQKHPGGEMVLLSKAGEDCSKEYDFHRMCDPEVYAMWQGCCIGRLRRPLDSVLDAVFRRP